MGEISQKPLKDLTEEERRRYYRDATAKSRGGRKRRSYLNDAEDAVRQIGRLEIILAWEAGQISEGTAAKMLGTDRVSAREERLNAIARGCGYDSYEEFSVTIARHSLTIVPGGIA